jgi:site-specific DNA recombinase
MRAALYARYSTDNQSEASVADQLALCRRFAEKSGAHVVREFSDAAISGSSLGNRPGVRALLASARAGEVDVVIAEHTDRLSRDGGDTWAIFKDLRALGVRYLTVNQGEITSMHVGLSGTMSELMLEEIARKTRRGLQGVVEAGRSGGGLTYGYRRKRVYDAAGEPVRGHLEIDPAHAEVVRRIFGDYAAGASPLAIAATLNTEAVPGPRGGQWNMTTIAGNAARGVGIIHNELYAGVRVWGRRTFVKDRTSGARKGRAAAGPPIRQPAPELAIVPPDLWAAVRARHAQVSTGPMGQGVSGRGRPKRLFSGLLVCGLCSRPLWRAGPRDAFRCSTRIEKGACTNSSAPGYAGIEARVTASLRTNLLAPEAIELAIREVQAAMAELRRESGQANARLSAELAEVKRRAARLVDQVADGVLTGAAVRDKLAELEARRAALEAEIAQPDSAAAAAADIIPIGPAAAGIWRRLIEELNEALADPESCTAEDRDAVRALISEIRVTPAEGHGQYDLELVGDLAPLLRLGNKKAPSEEGAFCSQSMGGLGAGTRVTRRHTFSAPFRQVA